MNANAQMRDGTLIMSLNYLDPMMPEVSTLGWVPWLKPVILATWEVEIMTV
jgi:hypothetical protein